jgi:hypothetical protein
LIPIDARGRVVVESEEGEVLGKGAAALPRGLAELAIDPSKVALGLGRTHAVLPPDTETH